MAGIDSLIDVFTGSVNISMNSLLINLIIAVILSGVLGFVYTRFGTSISNRASLARNFVIIAMTTTLIIMVVKSSLALSLGLVGALSIIRFRTAIKEPEELAYLFLTIAIGLGLGADQTLVTIIAVIAILVVIIGRRFLFMSKKVNQNLHLTIASQGPEKVSLDRILAVLNKHCMAIDLKRLDENKDVTEASFLVSFKEIGDMTTAINELKGISKEIKVTFLDYPGVL